jgi:A/G-specific adenine glycosylase
MFEIGDSIATKRKLFQQAILSWISRQMRDYPWRMPGRTPYEVLIAELLLKRTTSTAVTRVYGEFLYRFPSLKAINNASEEELAHVLSSIGLQHQRAKAIKALARHLSRNKSGEIPRDLNQLLAVPGLGNYSARAVLSFGFGVAIAVVDANVERILIRVFYKTLPPKKPRCVIQELADSLVPEKTHLKYNLGLLDLGALICRYINPLCDECPMKLICDYNNHGKDRLIKNGLGKCEIAIGTKLRKLRVGKRIGLAKLAHLSGVSKLTIIRIESGKTSAKFNTLSKLAAALEVDPRLLQ